MVARKKAQAPPPSPVRRKEDEGNYRFRRSAYARARKSLDRIRNEDEEPQTAGQKVQSAFESMRKGVRAALIMKRALAGDPTSSAEKGSAPAAPTATESFTVGRLLRRGSRDLRQGSSFGGIVPEPWSLQGGSFGSSMPLGLAPQERRVSGGSCSSNNPLLRLSIFGTRTATIPIIEPQESASPDEKATRRQRRRRKKSAVRDNCDESADVSEQVLAEDGKRLGRRRSRRKHGEDKEDATSEESEADKSQDKGGSRRRRRREKDENADDGTESKTSTDRERRRRRRKHHERGRAAKQLGDGHDGDRAAQSQDPSNSEEDLDSYSDEYSDSEYSDSESERADEALRRRYLIPNSSQVSLAETAQSSYFLPRCAQESLSFGRRRSTRRPGLELRQEEAKGLTARRAELELEMRDCLLELQAGCDELSDSAVFGWPGKELVRLHRLCRCAVVGLCGVYKELLAVERPRTPLGLQQEQAQLNEMLRLCRKAVHRVGELRRLCRSKDWKWLKTPAPWEQLSAPITSPRIADRQSGKKRVSHAAKKTLCQDPPWHTASVESLELLQHSVSSSLDSSMCRLGCNGWSSTSLTGSTESLRTWNDEFRLFPGFCQDTLQEAHSQDRWSQEREWLSLCGPYQTGQCSGRCPHGLQHRCIHCRGQHAGKDCLPAKVVRSVDPRHKKPLQTNVGEAHHRNLPSLQKRMERSSGGSSADLEVCGTMDHRHLQADLIKRASVAVKNLMLLLAKLPGAARVDDFPRLAAFVRSFEEHRVQKSQDPKARQLLRMPSFHLRRGMARL